MDNDFPANSQSIKRVTPKKADEKKVEKVITGEVITRKKSLASRFRETFSPANNRDVMESVLMDVLIPAAKDMVNDAVSTGVQRMLYGEAKNRFRRGGSRDHRSGFTSYRRMYDDPRSDRESGRDSRRGSIRERSTPRIDDIVLETRAEALTVIERLYDLIGSYEVATVNDLYDLIGTTGDFPDDRYGWRDMRGADVRRVQDGYLLELPRPEPIN